MMSLFYENIRVNLFWKSQIYYLCNLVGNIKI